MDGQVECIQSHVRQEEGLIRREISDTPKSRIAREKSGQECREGQSQVPGQAEGFSGG